MDQSFTCENQNEFESVFPELVESSKLPDFFEDLAWTNNWLAHAIQKNVPKGKKTRGLIVFLTFKSLASEEGQNEQNLHLAKVVGWCVEMLQAHALILDDIMDQSSTRRGAPCWYLDETSGSSSSSAIADAMMIYETIYFLIDKHCTNEATAPRLKEIFHLMSAKIWRGQSLDTRLNFQNSFEMYTMSTYKKMVKYKTSFYSFFYPVLLGMTLADFEDSELKKEVGEILMEIGFLFQVQDDFMDVFGDTETTKKIGTDIQDGKCSWLLVTALKLVSSSELEILKSHIGRPEAKSVAMVKGLFLLLNLNKLFKEFEESQFESICLKIEGIQSESLRNLLRSILLLNYKRKC